MHKKRLKLLDMTPSSFYGSIIYGVGESKLNCPLSSRQVNKQNLCPMYDTVHAWFFYAGMLKPIFNVTRWVL